jgi:hypothetical protein
MRKLIALVVLALAIAAIGAGSALGYNSPVDGCHHLPTPWLCAGGDL